MIELNILRERQKRYCQHRAFARLTFAYFIGLAFLAFILGVIYISERFILLDATDDIRRLSMKIRNETVLLERVGTYQNKMASLENKLVDCRAELGKRTLWTAKVAAIGESLPSGMWLTRISRTETSGEKGKAVLFVVEGALSPAIANERTTVTAFMDQLEQKTQSEFETISLREVKRVRRDQSADTVSFIVDCRVKTTAPTADGAGDGQGAKP